MAVSSRKLKCSSVIGFCPLARWPVTHYNLIALFFLNGLNPADGGSKPVNLNIAYSQSH